MNSRELRYIALITAMLYVGMDLFLGWIYSTTDAPPKYGWSVAADKKTTKKIQDTQNNFREVVTQYYAYGFKRWPEAADNKTRVLILGDSFTEMTYVSNGEEWYAYLEKAYPDIAFYVFGGGGYGTLQEYMVMDDHIDVIKPDAIIWQFCNNDYANNSYELDRKGYPFNNHHLRPYWEDNHIVYRLPLPYPTLRKYSFTAGRILKLYDRQRWLAATTGVKDYNHRRQEQRTSAGPRTRGPQRIADRNAVEVTKILFTKIKERAGAIPIYLFSASGELTDTDRSVCAAAGFQWSFFQNERPARLFII